MIKYVIVLLFAVLNLQAQDIGAVINYWKAQPLSPENVARAILDMQIENPVNAFKQTIKESGWKNGKTEYKSKLATIGNNIFGMRKAKQRLTTALNKTYFGHATYSHWIYSVLDYKYWQDFKPKKKNESYKKYLSRRKYNANKHYVDGLGYIKLTKTLIKIFENETDNEIQDSNIIDGSSDISFGIFPSTKTGNPNNLYRQGAGRYDGSVLYRSSKAGHSYRKSENYLQGCPGSSCCVRHGYKGSTAIHSRTRYSGKRYIQHQI